MKQLQTQRLYAARPDARYIRIFVFFALFLAIPVALVWLLPSFLIWSAPTLNIDKDLYAANRPIAFTFLDADGHVAGHRGAIVGERLKLGEMPPYLPAAFIAMEDRSFYENEGIDIRGLLRAMWMNMRAGHVVAGGSTITQQTAKIVFLSPRRTFTRKTEELLDAAALEKSLTKKQILELYLNRIYLGAGAYGVDGAAHVYFGKSARQLTLPEAAMLATLTRAPSAFSPRRDLAAAQARAGLVLRAMVETGAITKSDAEDARQHPAVITDRTFTDARNFFMDAAADEALKLTGSDGEGHDADLIVHTTFEPNLEEAARHALSHTLSVHGRHVRASEGAIVLMKTDGAIAALIGGRDYDASVFNRATQAKRQPGSAFKPFVYLAALEHGISPWDTRDDGPVDIDGWSPTNYGGRSYGSVTLAQAMAHSINTVTAKVAQEVGISNVIKAARRCGITSPLAANASLALGTSVVTPLELTSAYATFATGGYRVSPYLVTEIEDSTHRVLYQRTAPKPERVITPEVNRDLMAMLYGVLVEGTGRGAALPGREAAGKTGTTQDYRDAWFVGFTPDYVAGVWVGNDNYSPMRNVTGGTLPAAIWKSVMTVAEQGLPAKKLDKSSPPPPPENVAESDTDNDTGADAKSDNGEDDESAQGAVQSGHHSFWDWLFGRGGASGRGNEPPSGAAASEPQVAPSADEQPNSTAAPSAIARSEAEARATEDAPEQPGNTLDTPPVSDNDDDSGPPPPPRSPYAPPPRIVRRYVPPPPPPPPPDDDDDNDGN
ncbi:MAG TPA: PBP1A family penicillin-binding protein [Rhizomicrobium sp.]|nr:PBP1A family penicillin-binding protein [Rhizomicrobium sp.]